MGKTLCLGIIGLIIVAAAKATPPPPRHAYPAHRKVYWVCPIKPNGDPVTRPFGVCFRDFWP